MIQQGVLLRSNPYRKIGFAGNNIHQLIADMITYAKTIPPGDSLPPRTRPDDVQSPQFRATLDQLEGTIDSGLYAMLEEFLDHIIELENNAPSS